MRAGGRPSTHDINPFTPPSVGKRESKTSEFVRRAFGDFLQRHRSKPIFHMPNEPGGSKTFRAVYSFSPEVLMAAGFIVQEQERALASPQRPHFGLCEAFHGSNQGINKSPWCLLLSTDSSDTAFDFVRSFVIKEQSGFPLFVNVTLEPGVKLNCTPSDTL